MGGAPRVCNVNITREMAIHAAETASPFRVADFALSPADRAGSCHGNITSEPVSIWRSTELRSGMLTGGLFLVETGALGLRNLREPYPHGLLGKPRLWRVFSERRKLLPEVSCIATGTAKQGFTVAKIDIPRPATACPALHHWRRVETAHLVWCRCL